MSNTWLSGAASMILNYAEINRYADITKLFQYNADITSKANIIYSY